jgi:hypothetical protein
MGSGNIAPSILNLGTIEVMSDSCFGLFTSGKGTSSPVFVGEVDGWVPTNLEEVARRKKLNSLPGIKPRSSNP